MDPATILTLANAVLSAAPGLINEVETFAQKGLITVEQQAAVKAKYDALEARIKAGAFQGPEWQVTS